MSPPNSPAAGGWASAAARPAVASDSVRSIVLVRLSSIASMGLRRKKNSPPKRMAKLMILPPMPEPPLSGADASPERGSAAGLARELFKDKLARKSCPCDSASINRFDRWTVGYHSQAASVAADVTVYGVLIALPFVDLFDLGFGRAAHIVEQACLFPQGFGLEVFADPRRRGPGGLDRLIDIVKAALILFEGQPGRLAVRRDAAVAFGPKLLIGVEEDLAENQDENPDDREGDQERRVDIKHDSGNALQNESEIIPCSANSFKREKQDDGHYQLKAFD